MQNSHIGKNTERVTGAMASFKKDVTGGMGKGVTKMVTIGDVEEKAFS